MATTGRQGAVERHLDSARRMRRIRAALGLTQRDWAYYLRVAVPTVSHWETGHTRPSQLAEAQIRTITVSLGLDVHSMERFK